MKSPDAMGTGVTMGSSSAQQHSFTLDAVTYEIEHKLQNSSRLVTFKPHDRVSTTRDFSSSQHPKHDIDRVSHMTRSSPSVPPPNGKLYRPLSLSQNFIAPFPPELIVSNRPDPRSKPHRTSEAKNPSATKTDNTRYVMPPELGYALRNLSRRVLRC